jgi:hypothetical protein
MLRKMLLGAGAGAVAGIVQPMVGKLEEWLFFEEGEDTNIPRHFADAMAQKLHLDVPESARWAAGAAFHVGYALFWGAAYAVARERRENSPTAGSLALGAVLYGLAFSRGGAGVQMGSEPPPDRRPARYWLLTCTMPLTYGLVTAHVYERIRSL